MSAVWTEIACEVPTCLVEALSDLLVELSGNGVSIENQNVDTFSLDSIIDSPEKTIRAYFPGNNIATEIVARVEAWLVAAEAIHADYCYKKPVITLLNEEDWANAWKCHFRPQRIGNRLVIKPSWEEFVADADEIVLELDPGRAFGTGTHPTTRLCLVALERIFTTPRNYLAPTSDMSITVLDVGTGSGVLSMAAARLGASRVVGLDIDQDAVEVAHDNILLNGLEQQVSVATTPLEQLHESFTVVIANIIAEELVRLASLLVTATRNGGILVLSGILLEKSALVQQEYARFSMELLEHTEEGEWCCLCYRKTD